MYCDWVVGTAAGEWVGPKSGGVNFTIFSLLRHLTEVTGLYVPLVSQT